MLSTRSVMALLVMTVVAGLAQGSAATATSPGVDGILAWSGPAILGVDPGSHTERVIVDVPGGAEAAPSWTADGQQLAFEHDGDPATGFQASIWKANADGTGATQVTAGPNDKHPNWSPDGQRIVFVGPGTGDRDIFVVDADGSNLTQLTFTPGREKGPSWSPDGTKIAYEFIGGSGEEIWTMNSDGSGQTFVAPGQSPDWSPFGDELIVSGRYPNTGDLRRVSVDGSQTHSLGELGDDPVFSPDGTQIAYTKSLCCPFRYDIYTIGYAGGTPLPAADPSYRIYAGWQPLPSGTVPRYVRPKGATPLRVSLVPAFQPCDAPDRQHGPPLAFGACSAPQQTSSTATVGTPDANGAAANSSGSVRYDVQLGNPATPADEADVGIQADITDVRFASSNADYPVPLDIVTFVSITERETPLSQVTTTTPNTNTPAFYTWPLRVPVPCTTNSDPAIGSHCQVATTFDAVVPGAVPEGHRTIWGLEQVRVYDSGADGQVSSTDDNELFAVQGVFVP